MKSFLIALLLGGLIGAGIVWFYIEGREDSRAATRHQKSPEPTVEKAKESVETTAGRVKETIAAKLEALHLRPEDIKQELENTGKVVRRQAREMGATVADFAADARITATIKAKLVADSELSAWSISVNTTDRRVTLAGTVTSPELIGKAVLLAMETEGVTEVFSTLQVKK